MTDVIGPYNQVDFSPPAQSDRYLGSAFRHQTTTGVIRTDPVNDRVDFVAGDDTHPLEQVSYRLGADVPSDAQQAAGLGLDSTGSGFGFIAYAEDPSPGPEPSYTDTISGTAAQVPNQGGWYATLRPYAGTPYPGTSDEEYALVAGETEPVVRGEYPSTLTYIDATRDLPDRRVKDIPDKASRNPASPNDERPWDITMGAWPWTGQKAAMQQPVTSMPRFYPDPLPKDVGIPSPTGAAGGMWPNTVDLTPYPLTWRLTPSPYDTAQAGYIDSGTTGY